MLFMRESYAYVILQRKTERLRKERGSPHFRSALDTAEGAAQSIHRATDQDAVSVSNRVLDVAPRGHHILGPVPLVHDLPSRIRNPIRLLRRERRTDVSGYGNRILLRSAFCGAVSDRPVTALTKRNQEYRLPVTYSTSECCSYPSVYSYTAGRRTRRCIGSSRSLRPLPFRFGMFTIVVSRPALSSKRLLY